MDSQARAEDRTTDFKPSSLTKKSKVFNLIITVRGEVGSKDPPPTRYLCVQEGLQITEFSYEFHL